MIRSEVDVFFTPEFIEVLRQNLRMAEETWHKVMNPLCGACMAERGKAALERAASVEQATLHESSDDTKQAGSHQQ